MDHEKHPGAREGQDRGEYHAPRPETRGERPSPRPRAAEAVEDLRMANARLTKQQRLEEYFRRLEKLPPFGSFDDARSQLAVTLNRVEDELTSIPFDPERWAEGGRMYPPQEDNILPVEGREGVWRLNSVAHRILYRPEWSRRDLGRRFRNSGG